MEWQSCGECILTKEWASSSFCFSWDKKKTHTQKHQNLPQINDCSAWYNWLAMNSAKWWIESITAQQELPNSAARSVNCSGVPWALKQPISKGAQLGSGPFELLQYSACLGGCWCMLSVASLGSMPISCPCTNTGGEIVEILCINPGNHPLCTVDQGTSKLCKLCSMAWVSRPRD